MRFNRLRAFTEAFWRQWVRPVVVGQPRKASLVDFRAILDIAQVTVSLHPCHGSYELYSRVSKLHLFFETLLGQDHAFAVTLMKSLSAWWVAFLRLKANRPGDPLPPIMSIPESAWDSDFGTGAPFQLVPLVLWYRRFRTRTSRPDMIRLLQVSYMVLSAHRVLRYEVQPSLNTILQPTLSQPTQVLIKRIPKALANLGITPELFYSKLKDECRTFSPEVLSSKGPNGYSTWSGYEDACAVMGHSGIASALKVWGHKLSPSNMSDLIKRVKHCAEEGYLKFGVMAADAILGRLHFIEEWGGKTRIVAIVDWWTQMALTPLHNTINSFLRELNQDGTFDQDTIVDRVRSWVADETKEVYSFDLTAATDRLPIWFQEEVLKHLLGRDLAKCWRVMMTSRAFVLPNGEEEVLYAAGQPMGARSSFPMLALSHHVIVQIAADVMKVEGPFEDYVVLGDDNTLADGVVATAYLSIMGLLEMEISTFKSITHADDSLSAGEICKRIFIEDYELTALPPKLLAKVSSKGDMAPGLQNTLYQRGCPIDPGVFYLWLSSFVRGRNLRSIMILNKLPVELSGLFSPINHNYIPDYTSWFKHFTVTREDLINCFNFHLIVNQLKRVDQLILVSERIRSIVFSSAKSNIEGLDEAKAKSPDIEVLFGGKRNRFSEEALLYLPHLTFNHPIVRSVMAEYTRMKSHLVSVRLDDEQFTKRLKRGLLDLFRNPMTEIWFNREDRKHTVNRVLLNKTLDSLTRLDKPVKTWRGLHYRMLSPLIGKNWHISVEIGGKLISSPSRMRVSLTVEQSMRRLHDVITSWDVKGFRL